MIKFKRTNVMKLAQRYNCEYFLLDIIRQTAIERIVDYVNTKFVGTSREQFIDAMLKNARLVLNKIIIFMEERRQTK